MDTRTVSALRIVGAIVALGIIGFIFSGRTPGQLGVGIDLTPILNQPQSPVGLPTAPTTPHAN